MLKTYLIILISGLLLFLTGFYLRKKLSGKCLRYLSYAVFVFMIIESLAIAGIRLTEGYWTFRWKENPNKQLFEADSIQVAVPRKNISLKIRNHLYSHNSQGFRSREISPVKDKIRVMAIGGSTTYGVGVNDNETWPYYLDSLGNDRYEVFNCGVSGHSTWEHLAQCKVILPAFKADIVLVHCGLNDLRASFTNCAEESYQAFHQRTLKQSLGIDKKKEFPPFATLIAASIFLDKRSRFGKNRLLPMRHINPLNEPDTLLAIKYRQNLKKLIAVIRNQGAEPVFIPQVLIYQQIKGGKLRWWIPGLNDEGIIRSVNLFNKIMEEVASEENVIFAGNINRNKWTSTDFADPSHLNATGNLRFASMLQEILLSAIAQKNSGQPLNYPLSNK